MQPKLVQTITGIGDDGRTYTINAYKEMRRQGDQWVEEQLISIIKTDENEELYCESEEPLVFHNPKTNVRIRCDQSQIESPKTKNNE